MWSCPNSNLINKYLLEQTGFEGNLTNNSKVCFSCYKCQLEILKETSLSSTDTDLSQLITSLNKCAKDVNDTAMHHTSIFVAEFLLQGESLLLPTAHAFFDKTVQELVGKHNLSNDETKVSVTSRWILSNLTISLGHRIGKTTFYRYLFQHTKFITSGGLPGTLADIGLRDNSFEMGFLSFLRLVGVTYFKKNNSGFSQATPEALFHSFSLPDQTPLYHHKLWIGNIRVIIGDRCHFENEMLPSLDALYRHWKRTCWVLDMWSQANKNSVQLLPLSGYGWKIHNNSLTIDWDSPANVAAVDARVTGLLKGCKCKAGCRCSCRNKGKECSIGCDCINCTNTQAKGNEELLDIVVNEYLAEVAGESIDVPDEANDILDWEFGSEELEYDEEYDEENIFDEEQSDSQ